MKTVGRPKFGLNRLSVARASSAVSLSALSTSTSSSMRPAPPKRIVLDTRRSSSDCDDSRRDPRGSSRMRWSPCGSEICAVAAHGLPLKYCRLARDHETRPRHVDRAHDPEHVRPIVRQPAVRVGEVVRIAPERDGGRERRRDGADLRIRGGRSAGRLQSVGPREGIGAERLPPVRPALFHHHHQAVVRQRVSVGVGQQEAPTRPWSWRARTPAGCGRRQACASPRDTARPRPSMR